MFSRPTFGLIDVVDVLGQHGAEQTELGQHIGLAIGVGAHVQQYTKTAALLGYQVGMQGRMTPGMGFTLKMLPTSMAPVLPVLAKASILPSFIRWNPMLMLLLRLGLKRFGGVVAAW
jgi:hypothetical protein